MMKKLIFALPIFLAACSNPNNNASEQPAATEKMQVKSITIKGSETARPVIEKLKVIYMKKHPGVYIDYAGGGSNAGIKALEKNEADLIFISRPLQADEAASFAKSGKEIKIQLFAYDGIAVITNLNNRVKQLTLKQLAAIYTGQITDWNALGGEKSPIMAYSRDSSSGTYLFFKEHVLHGGNYSDKDINLVHNDEIKTNVRDHHNAIGYMGIGDVSPDVKVLKITDTSELQFYEPSLPNIKSKVYPLSREISFLYYNEQSENLEDFIAFLGSNEVKQIITECGFLVP